MPKWEGIIFIIIVFTILKDTDSEIVMQNHYVCYNYFGKYFWQCSFLFPTDYLYFKKILRVQVHKNCTQKHKKVLNYQCQIFLEKNNLQKLCKKSNTEQVLTINLKIFQQKNL